MFGGHGLESQYQAIVDELRQTFDSGKTTLRWRLEQLALVRKALEDHQQDIVDAMRKDLGRAVTEIKLCEFAGLIGEVDHVSANLSKWVKPEQVSHPLLLKPGHSVMHSVPKGVMLHIAPWNFPIQLTIAPLIASIASGNCAVIKPSELAPNCADVIEKLVGHLDQSAFRVIKGEVKETTALLKVRFDHIMYTGNGTVAKIIMKAAAEHLTPVTLELGGKSPVIIDDDANIKAIARVMWGKFMNGGQTCVAPDYVLVTAKAKDKVVNRFKELIIQFYGADASQSKDYCRIINERHWTRIQGLLEGHGGKAWSPEGAKPADKADRYIPPTLVEDVNTASKIMTEEIFGPVLPIITVPNIDKAIEFVSNREPPLALYVFSETPKNVEKVIASTQSGGICVNDVIYHLANPELPFGGVGPSGMGQYHGKWGFDEFSHKRSVMYRPTWMDPKERYPPYDDKGTEKMMKMVMGPIVPKPVKYFFYSVIVPALGFAAMHLLSTHGVTFAQRLQRAYGAF